MTTPEDNGEKMIDPKLLAQWANEAKELYPANGDYLNRDGLLVGYLAGRQAAFEEYSKQLEEIRNEVNKSTDNRFRRLRQLLNTPHP